MPHHIETQERDAEQHLTSLAAGCCQLRPKPLVDALHLCRNRRGRVRGLRGLPGLVPISHILRSGLPSVPARSTEPDGCHCLRAIVRNGGGVAPLPAPRAPLRQRHPLLGHIFFSPKIMGNR